METKNIKTLPISLSGVALGIMLSAADYHVDWKVAGCIVAAAVIMHLFSAMQKGTIGFFCLMGLTVAAIPGTLYLSFGRIFMLENFILMILCYMAYSHRSTSRLYSFLFYGLTAVYGAYFVCSHSFGSWVLVFPVVAIGALTSAAFATESGSKKIYAGLVTLGYVAMTAYSCLRMFDPWHFLYLLSLPLFIWKKDSRWPLLAFAVLSGLGYLIYLF